MKTINDLSVNTRMLIASFFAGLIIIAWQILYAEPLMHQQMLAKKRQEVRAKQQMQKVYTPLAREEVLKAANHRVAIMSDTIAGSINLQGARIDDIVFRKYGTDADHAKNVALFSPSNTNDSYFAEFGWVAEEGADMPNQNTIWQASKDTLKNNDNISLFYVNKQGVRFVIDISLDDNYMFTIKQKVVNNSNKAIEVSPYSLIARYEPHSEGNAVIHEGPIAVVDGKLKELNYKDLQKSGAVNLGRKVDWVGFSDKYWLAALIAVDDGVINGAQVSHFSTKHNKSRMQISQMHKIAVDSKDSQIISTKLFAGAKELKLLDYYAIYHNIELFDRAVDFGYLYFITKPIFQMLSYFYEKIGNFGVAILLLTVFIKLLLFPLAYKGFRGMNKLKDLQPKMEELKERYKDSPSDFQKELFALYKKEKVNPMAGCLPILMQIPVFFALYKVLCVSLEMRHAKFFMWISDLSAPDPLLITNLFGLIPWNPPSLLAVGLFPSLMAVTMYFQQKLSPEPTDPTQAQVMKLLPVVFLFMFSSFPVGLVIYWTWSNILSIGQQVAIKKLDTKRQYRKKKQLESLR